MGIFSTKKIEISNENIVSDICGDLGKALMLLVDEGSIPLEKSIEMWAIISAVGEGALDNDSERANLIQHLESVIIATNHKESFRQRQSVRFYETLYSKLNEKNVANGVNIIGSLNDLLNTINRLSLAEREQGAQELSMPLFLHYFNEAAVRASDDSGDFEMMAFIVSMTFASIAKYILKSKSLYTEANWVRQLDLLRLIMATIVVRWGYLRFANSVGEPSA